MILFGRPSAISSITRLCRCVSVFSRSTTYRASHGAVGQALAKLAKTINYRVTVAASHADRESYPDADRVQANLNLSGLKIAPQTFIVVSTQGECDEEALENALQTEASYVAFVASKAKAAKVLQHLGDRGINADRLKQVRAPAGMSIPNGSPEEIAVSILAEIVQLNRSRAVGHEEAPALPGAFCV